jgi:hypothetical protein
VFFVLSHLPPLRVSVSGLVLRGQVLLQVLEVRCALRVHHRGSLGGEEEGVSKWKRKRKRQKRKRKRKKRRS